jgi:hypothetical protein
MSLQWSQKEANEYWESQARGMVGIPPYKREVDLDIIRPAGEGPLQRELCADVAREMRRQEREELERMWNFSEKAGRAVRGPQWRVWLTCGAVGFAAGTIATLIFHLMH